ncbi:hypothetical protein CCACVL1_08480 [Corchorus capsularis]|uniref:CCHC-type domain-containing protein n=1 Tax=Corchorus capsularis TaxID=210143 RepID=A0A1R3J0E5_COCAP|nr:hypothetical protein CCACVL1_08480 [Corchorus capsularis]
MEIHLESHGEATCEATKFLLIGKILSDKPINRKGALGVLRSMWGGKDCPVITELGMQIYGLAFQSEAQMFEAMVESPWSVMGCCLILKKWEIDKPISEIPFDRVQFWVQIHELPLDMQTLDNLKKIDNSIGRVVMLEKPEWNQGTGRCYMRMRIELDVKNPLIPGFWVPRQGRDKLWVKLKYEKLSDFCFVCGRLGHHGKYCDKSGNGLSRDNPYGPWMRVAPVRRTFLGRLIDTEEKGVPALPEINPVENAGILTRVYRSVESEGVPELPAIQSAEDVGSRGEPELETEAEFFSRQSKSLARPRELTRELESSAHGPNSERAPHASRESVTKVLGNTLHKCASACDGFSGATISGDFLRGNLHENGLCRIRDEHVDNQEISMVKREIYGTSGVTNLADAAAVRKSLERKHRAELVSLNKENLLPVTTCSVYNPTSEKDSISGPELASESDASPPSVVKEAFNETVLFHVEVGLTTFFRNLNLKRSLEEIGSFGEVSNKKIWVEVRMVP